MANQVMEIKLNTSKIERPDKTFFVHYTYGNNNQKVIVKFKKTCNLVPEVSGLMKVNVVHTSLTTEQNYKGNEDIVLWVGQVEDFKPFGKKYKAEDFFTVQTDDEIPY